MATWSNSNKATTAFDIFARHGRDIKLDDIKDLTFEDALFEDGTKVKDAVFSDLQDQVWSNTSKSSSPTFTNQTRN